MSIGLMLLAKFNQPRKEPVSLLNEMAGWIKERSAGLDPTVRQWSEDSSHTLFCQLHPAAEEVEFRFVDPTHLIVSANTSTVGPGYHIYLCSLLRDWASRFEASWLPESDDYGDEAEYFFTGDEGMVFRHMTRWLEALAGSFFDGTLDSDISGTALCMSMDISYETNELAITPLGPRSREWLYEASKDGLKGKDFFAWWKPGLNAGYYLGRALAQMWTNVRWRPPINNSERALLEDVASNLRAAYDLDSTLDYPWAEWREILDLIGTSAREAQLVRARATGSPRIGHRRRNVTVTLPGRWRVKIPGSFSEFEPDEENNFYALDPPREIWFTSYQFTAASPVEKFASMKKEMIESKAEYLLERDHYVAKANITEKTRENGERYFVLGSSNRCLTQRSVCTILFSQPDEKEWALSVWRSIQHPTQPEAQEFSP